MDLYGSSILINDLFINYLPTCNLKQVLYSFRITDPAIKREQIQDSILIYY